WIAGAQDGNEPGSRCPLVPLRRPGRTAIDCGEERRDILPLLVEAGEHGHEPAEPLLRRYAGKHDGSSRDRADELAGWNVRFWLEVMCREQADLAEVVLAPHHVGLLAQLRHER